MATTIKTVMTYPLDGATTDFNIPFEYLARKFVRVTLIGVDRKELILNQDYRFATKTTISTTRALGPADGYSLIEIRRYTSSTERLVDFTDGSILRAYDLNISQVQTLHVAEEARDLTADTIGVNNDGDLDARGRRIVNVVDAKDPGDAIPLGQVQRWNDSALNSKNAAKVSETNAKTSETNSKTSETNSKVSETNSKASENLAHDWAQKAENSVVVGNEYSSYHYSRKAAASATASASSASAASSSASAAAASATAGAVSAATAKTEADRAKTEADRAQSANPDEQLKKLNNLSDVSSITESLVNLGFVKNASDVPILPMTLGGTGGSTAKEVRDNIGLSLVQNSSGTGGQSLNIIQIGKIQIVTRRYRLDFNNSGATNWSWNWVNEGAKAFINYPGIATRLEAGNSGGLREAVEGLSVNSVSGFIHANNGAGISAGWMVITVIGIVA